MRLVAFRSDERREGYDEIAHDPRDQEWSLQRDRARSREDEHQHVESRHGGGSNSSTVSHNDQVNS